MLNCKMLNEGLVLGHRPFFVMGGEVHLDIYDDRIALTSRQYRNRRVGDFLKELDLTEGRNTSRLLCRCMSGFWRGMIH